MISTILFDLDGTIIDSEPLAFQALLEISPFWGISINKQDAASAAGKKWEIAFDLLYQKYSIPLPKEQASQQVIDKYRELMQTKGPIVVPGVVEAIADFSKQFRMGLVSGSHRHDVLWALNKLNLTQYFQVVLGAEDYPESKPSPVGYLKALELLQSKPHEALVFEDSQAGIASSVAAGIKVVAVFSTNHFGHDLSAANHEIRDFQGVTAEWVAKL